MRVISLIDELRCDNEIRQSEACSELSQGEHHDYGNNRVLMRWPLAVLLLGNEESLPNFPIRDLVLCLMTLLNKDHNIELVSAR